MRKVASEKEPEEFRCIFIPADGNRNAPPNRPYVEGAMTEVTLPVTSSSPMVPYLVSQLLQCETPIEIANFYDRDPDICDWYYQVFGSDDLGQPNSIGNILHSRNHPNVTGDILVMKSGPQNGIWKWSPDLCPQSLAETLWWYRQSGRDIATVFNERGLKRILGEIA